VILTSHRNLKKIKFAVIFPFDFTPGAFESRSDHHVRPIVTLLLAHGS